jgi:hypothetical protein
VHYDPALGEVWLTTTLFRKRAIRLRCLLVLLLVSDHTQGQQTGNELQQQNNNDRPASEQWAILQKVSIGPPSNDMIGASHLPLSTAARRNGSPTWTTAVTPRSDHFLAARVYRSR